MIQGKVLEPDVVSKVVKLLKETDLGMFLIAERMKISRHSVYAVNKKYGIREYDGKRSTFTLN